MPSPCDAHLHVVGRPRERDAAVDAARRHLAAVGAGRAVVVQAAGDGGDPSALLRALPRLGVAARGVVSDEAADPASLPVLHAAGVRGIRVSGLAGTTVTLGRLRAAAALASGSGWHLAYYPMDSGEWLTLGPELGRVGVPVVIDHMALRAWDTASGPDQAGFRLLLDLVGDGVWVKISGAFRRGTPPRWTEALPYARLIAERGPDRVVWGSDWPYLAFDGPVPTASQLLGWLGEAVPGEAERRRIQVRNPSVLYDFENLE
jgi:2-pyrone-4,6-dicarboxylate lactonase